MTGEMLLKALDDGTSRCVPYYIDLYLSTVIINSDKKALSCW